MKSRLYIDGQNFFAKMKSVFEYEKVPLPKWHTYDFKALFDKSLAGIEIDERVVYFAQLNVHPDSQKKSEKLIQERRLLKTHLEQQGFRYYHAGNVQGNYQKDARGKKVLVFREKGVDVHIAVDMVKGACDGDLKMAILCSSDSDLQPAVKELRHRKIECIYLGFELQPNKGLTYTTSRTILIRNSEVLSCAIS